MKYYGSMTIGYNQPQDGFVLGNIPFVPATRERCVVCGHPSSDCSDGPELQNKNILGVDIFPSLQRSTKIVVQEDVWEMVNLTPYTQAKVLVARAGQQISVEKAKELGLL